MERVLEMDLGNKILYYRKKVNLSQEKLANIIGVSRQTISKWELNETTPDLRQAIKLAEVFGIGMDEFMNDLMEDDSKVKDKNLVNSNIFIFLLGGLFVVFLIGIVVLISYIFEINIYREKGTIGMVCIIDEDEYGYAITYDDTNDILMVDGSPYILENIYNRKIHKKVVSLITDVNDYFKDNGGYCE